MQWHLNLLLLLLLLLYSFFLIERVMYGYEMIPPMIQPPQFLYWQPHNP
jgi:hypothetical protein